MVNYELRVVAHPAGPRTACVASSLYRGTAAAVGCMCYQYTQLGQTPRFVNRSFFVYFLFRFFSTLSVHAECVLNNEASYLFGSSAYLF